MYTDTILPPPPTPPPPFQPLPRRHRLLRTELETSTTPAPSSATLYEIAQGATATPPVTPVAIATAIGSAPSRVLVDSAPSVWTTSGTTSINHTVCTTPDTAAGCSSTSTTTGGPTYGIAATAIYTVSGPVTRNSIFVSVDGTSNSLTLYQGIGTTYSQITGWPVTGLSTPAAVAADGAQNAWTVNNFAGANSVFEIGIGKQQLSPAAGFQKSATYLGRRTFLGHRLIWQRLDRLGRRELHHRDRRCCGSCRSAILTRPQDRLLPDHPLTQLQLETQQAPDFTPGPAVVMPSSSSRPMSHSLHGILY